MRIETNPLKYPLSRIIAVIRKYRPPDLSQISSMVGDARHLEEFLGIVGRVLPEELATIKGLRSPGHRLERFARVFEQRYFPLGVDDWWAWNEDEPVYASICEGISISYRGMESDWYHEFDSFSEGWQMMGAFSIRDAVGYWGEGVETVWYETVAAIVGEDSVTPVSSRGGWTVAQLMDLLEGSRYIGIAHFGAYMGGNTDNPFLDCHYEYPLSASWTMGAVEWLTEKYRESEKIWEAIAETTSWLEENPTVHFREVLTYLLEQEEVQPDD